jgi:hypothetical protein
MVPSFTEKANKFVRPTDAMGREGSRVMNCASQLWAARIPPGAVRMDVIAAICGSSLEIERFCSYGIRIAA